MSDGPLVDWTGQWTGGISGHQLHQSPVLLPPAGGAWAELLAGGTGQLRSDLLSPQSVTPGYPEPPPADQRTGQDVGTGQPGENSQQDVLGHVHPVRHHQDTALHYTTLYTVYYTLLHYTGAVRAI